MGLSEMYTRACSLMHAHIDTHAAVEFLADAVQICVTTKKFKDKKERSNVDVCFEDRSNPDLYDA